MTILEAKQIRLVDYLEFLGYKPVKIRSCQYWYHSPLREELSPSFKVNDSINEWYDFGLAEGGDIIELGKHLFKTISIYEVLAHIAQHTLTAPPMRVKAQSIPPPPIENIMRNEKFLPLTHSALLSYIKSRLVMTDIAKLYCEEIHYQLHGRYYFAIAFRNNSGGYEIRNAYYKGCYRNKDITLLPYKSGLVQEHLCLFEGFMDFLSYMTLHYQNNSHICIQQEADFMVMNSVSNLKKVLEVVSTYKHIHCYLDNDLAGHKTVETLRGLYADRIKDESVRYQEYKDLNDYLRGKLM